jgi:methionyl-tRNA formyltransferase
MRVIFAGTPAFAVPSLLALVDCGHKVVLALTQPDRPSGRGLAAAPSPVKVAAERLGIPVYQPERLRDPATHLPLLEARADVMVVAAYGLILPQAVLDIPRLGAVNVHASLLPRWRGAAPIQRALLAGDAETGACIMQMDAGLDTGGVLLRESIPITRTDTTATLHDKLAALGARLLPPALEGLELGTLHPLPQPQTGVTYAHKVDKGEARIDWRRTAAEIERQVRAFDPHPGASSGVGGTDVKIWHATAEPHAGEPGLVTGAGPDGIVVGCGAGSLRILGLQRAGGRRLDPATFLRGFPLAPGDRFDFVKH